MVLILTDLAQAWVGLVSQVLILQCCIGEIMSVTRLSYIN